MTTDYENYSLGKLNEWVFDALENVDDPEKIYQVIVQVVEESVEYHQTKLNKANKLLSLLQSQTTKVCDVNDTSEYCRNSWNSFWEPEVSQYTEEELNAMCDKAASDQEKELCREYNTREAEYYNKPEKVSKWVLPVELSYVDGVEDYLISLPTDLLSRVDWKEGDQLEWVPQEDNSYVLRKVVNES